MTDREALLAEMTPPDLHALIRAHGGWADVPAEARPDRQHAGVGSGASLEAGGR